MSAAGGQRAQLPWSPTHLDGEVFSIGHLKLGWVRRGRINADDWAPAEIPLDEPSESYRVEFVSLAGVVMRSVTVTTPTYTYAKGSRVADFGAAPHAFEVRVRQIGAAGEGIAAARRFEFA